MSAFVVVSISDVAFPTPRDRLRRPCRRPAITTGRDPRGFEPPGRQGRQDQMDFGFFSKPLASVGALEVPLRCPLGGFNRAERWVLLVRGQRTARAAKAPGDFLVMARPHQIILVIQS